MKVNVEPDCLTGGKFRFEDPHPEGAIPYLFDAGKDQLFRWDKERREFQRERFSGELTKSLKIFIHWAFHDQPGEITSEQFIQAYWGDRGGSKQDFYTKLRKLRQRFDDDRKDPDGKRLPNRIIQTLGSGNFRFAPPLTPVQDVQQHNSQEIANAVEKARQFESHESVGQFSSTIPARGHLPFVGREALLEQIESEMRDLAREKVVVLCGSAAVGKSELAFEFARLHRENYPGGTFFIDASTDAIAIELARVGKNILNLSFPAHLSVDDQGQKTFFSLGRVPALLVYDNVDSYEFLKPWIPRHGMACHVLVTTVIESHNLAWPMIKVPPLTKNESLEMLGKLVGAEIAALYGNAIADHADGLPLEIIHHAKSAAYEHKRCREYNCSGIGPDTTKSFNAVYQRLDPTARILAHGASFLNPQRIPQKELSHAMWKGLGWSSAQFDKALDSCLDLNLLDGNTDLRIHQLDARFINDSKLSPGDKSAVESIRRVQIQRFTEVAGTVKENPADTDAVGILISYPLSLDAWGKTEASDQLKGVYFRTIGEALFKIGRFATACPWFERAVTEAEKGDEHGRVDHEDLADNLHFVGQCLRRSDFHGEARLWYERAVEARQRESKSRSKLVDSMYSVGACLLAEGRLEEARSWCDRSLALAEAGDGHGCIDHHALATSVFAVAECIMASGHFTEALPWYERAMEEAEKGDEHGRVHHDDCAFMLGSTALCLIWCGQFDEARPWLERAESEATNPDQYGRLDHAEIGAVLLSRGVALYGKGRFEESLAWCERALKQIEKGDTFGRINQHQLADAYAFGGKCLVDMQKCHEAQPWLERSIVEYKKCEGYVRHDVVSNAYSYLASCYGELDNIQEALECFRRAAEEAEKANKHQGLASGTLIGGRLKQMGDCLLLAGRTQEALPQFERAVAEVEKGDEHGRINHEVLGQALHQVGNCLDGCGRVEEALQWFQRALEAKQKGDVFGRVHHNSIGVSCDRLGSCLSNMGRVEEGVLWLQRAVEARQKGDVSGRVDHKRLCGNLHRIGAVLYHASRVEEALPWFERAVEEAEKGDEHGRIDHVELGNAVHWVGHALSKMERFDEARPWFERAVVEAEQGDASGRIDHNSLGVSLHEVGNCLCSKGQEGEALPWFERAVEAKQKGDLFGRTDHVELGNAVVSVGRLLFKMERFDEARPWFERAVKEAEQGDASGRVDHNRLSLALHEMGVCLIREGKREDARLWLERAVEEAKKGDVDGRVDHGRLYVSTMELSNCWENRSAKWLEEIQFDLDQEPHMDPELAELLQNIEPSTSDEIPGDT